MAYDFDGTNDYIDCGDIAIDGLALLGVSLRFNIDVNNDFTPFFCKSNAGFTQRLQIMAGGAPSWGDSNELAVAVDSGVNNTTAQNLLSTATWHHVFVWYDGSQATNQTKAKAWFNGSAVTWNATAGTVPTTLPTLTEHLLFGRNQDVGTAYYNGKLAEVAIWTGLPGGMAAADAALILSRGYSPNFLRKNGLHYYPLVRDAKDHWGGNTGTITEAVPFAHPRIIMPRSSKMRRISALADTRRVGITGLPSVEC